MGIQDALSAAMAALHEAASFRHAALHLADIQTMLPTAGLVEGISPDTREAFWKAEFEDAGFNRFVDLARSPDPVATLGQAMGGENRRAQAYLDIFSPPRFADELRVVFVSGGLCRGFAHILREEPFTMAEIADVRHIALPIAQALHQASAVGAEPGTGSGILVVDAEGSVVHATIDARKMLDEIRTSPPFDTTHSNRVPALLISLVSKARSDVDGHPVATRVRGASGLWFRVSAARTEADGHVAIVIEPARTADLIPVVFAGFGLTAREISVAGCLARGLRDKEIAAELSLSTYTVRDHVKAVLAKCDVGSRGELVARIFVDHVRPVLERALIHRL
jgi:DNA-binding CsgD family transcriptional regulator